MTAIKKVILVSTVMLIAGFFAVDEVRVQLREPAIPEIEITEEITLENTSDITYSELGIMRTTWYGPGFHGKLTANGEVYDQEGFTAAHKTLPFGTLLKVTNPKNGKWVIVRVNDRGPFGPTNDLDLSKGAARSIDMVYTGKIRAEVEKINLIGADAPVIASN